MNIALIGYGGVGRAFAGLLASKQAQFPFRIAGIHTARHGTAIARQGLPIEAAFGPPSPSVEAFLDAVPAEVVVELTPLNPESGEPAISHIRAAFSRGRHVITANKGPIAFSYRALAEEAARAGVLFRFESIVMDGAPVFNMVRQNLPGVKVLGFFGALNSTSKIVIEAMREGHTMEEGIAAARRLGITEADASFDIDGWDSAAKTAALANVLMDAGVTPRDVDRRGVGKLTPDRLEELARKRKTVCLVSRARMTDSGLRLRVRAEVLEETDPLASVRGTSNLLFVETDLMGTLGTISISPGVGQTAYGVFSDLVDIAKNL